MPLTQSGQKVMRSMKQQYGSKKGESVFYASINKGVKGSSEWERNKAGSHSPVKFRKREKAIGDCY